jgi:hypothetical protein
MCGSASDRMRAWSRALIKGASVMKRVSLPAGWGGFYLIGGQRAKLVSWI